MDTTRVYLGVILGKKGIYYMGIVVWFLVLRQRPGVRPGRVGNSPALNPKPPYTLCPILRSLDLALSAAVSAVGGGDPCPANGTICQLQRRLASSRCVLRLALGLSAK